MLLGWMRSPLNPTLFYWTNRDRGLDMLASFLFACHPNGTSHLRGRKTAWLRKEITRGQRGREAFTEKHVGRAAFG